MHDVVLTRSLRWFPMGGEPLDTFDVIRIRRLLDDELAMCRNLPVLFKLEPRQNLPIRTPESIKRALRGLYRDLAEVIERHETDLLMARKLAGRL